MSEEAQIIREALINFDYRPRRPTDIYVTDVVVCPRRAFFNLRFNANPMVSNPKAVAGKAMHMLIQQALKSRYPNAIFEVSCQYPLDDGYVLLGRADMIDGDTVYEFKYTSMYNQAKEMYFAQANCYACMLDCRKFKVVIIDRGKLDVLVLEGERSDNAFMSVVDQCNQIIKCLKAKDEELAELPSKSPWGWACDNCAYKLVCRMIDVRGGTQ